LLNTGAPGDGGKRVAPTALLNGTAAANMPTHPSGNLWEFRYQNPLNAQASAGQCHCKALT
jgi:hypothetical protein